MWSLKLIDVIGLRLKVLFLWREVITFSSMARVINVNLYKQCLLKKLAAKKILSTRCTRLVWQGLTVDIHSVFQKMKGFVLLYVIMSASGGKSPPTTQKPTKPHNPSPQLPHPSKKIQQSKLYMTKVEPILRTKRILMSYGLSGDMGYLTSAESKAKAKGSWL